MRRLMLLLVALLAALVPCLNAQRMVAGRAHFGPHFARGEHSRPVVYPFAFGGPFYSDYVTTAPVPTSQPPVVVLQTSPASAPVAESPSPAQPLMIELRGDRYVRISGEESSGAQIIDPTVALASQPTRVSGAASHAVNDATLPIAVLLFHDGHREETTSYTITDGVLYINASPYTGGPWIRKIELTSLDLAETISFNQSRGIKFPLPSAPNEVLVGP